MRRLVLAFCWLVLVPGALAQEPAVSPPPGQPEEAAKPAAPKIESLGGTRQRLGRIEFDKATREIQLPAAVNMTKGLLEYVLVSEKGKLHESLLSTPVGPLDLNVVLLLLNYAPAPEWHVPPAKPKPLEAVAPAAKLACYIRFKNAEGAEETVPAETWVNDLRTKKAAAASPWVYNGSNFNDEHQFSAEVDGSILSLYLDPRCLVNNPRQGADDDERWVPAKGIPPKGTSVTVVLKPAASSAASTDSKKPADSK